MKLHKLYTLILCAIIPACIISCSDDANDWPVDPSYDAPFRSTGFEAKTGSATSIYITYKGVLDASKYVFEFSEGDSLLFNNIVRTVDILADTLTVYSDNKAPTKREYRTLFEDLKGTTRYSVRMKAIDKSNRETGYVQLSFATPAEQVMTWHRFGINDVTIQWDAKRPINKFLYGIDKGEENVYKTRTLTSAEQAAGIATLTGLESGTRYNILLMLDDQNRGSLKGVTLGKAGSSLIEVEETTNINELLTAQVALGNKNLTLSFPLLPNDGIYEIGQINIPDGIESLYFAGSSTEKELPKLFLHAVRLNGVVEDITFSSININARTNATAYFFNVDNAERYFKNVRFLSCEINNISRSLVRLSAAIDVNEVIIDDCIIFNVAVSGYGFYNTGNKNMSLKKFSITNTTMREIGDQVGDIQGVHDMFIMDHVTFCNYTTGLPKFIRWRNAPGGSQLTNNIITGTNNDAVLNSVYGTQYYMDFTSCYKTNEWTWGNYEFTNITEVAMSGEELFVDPRGGDFHIKEGVRFAGANKVGDPRWWE
ncbi:DUF5123 domain-containing protein [Bacteroides sp. 214]|uniref:DUF5123 domain-containing protein n=1 Tax=Bacteroides sp. 214 TaxID=2302935 RepID=UPI0013D006E1|nr:DUF5123 domain-containing protein [Bacteroides sp. 214]